MWHLTLAAALFVSLIFPVVSSAYPRDDAAMVEVEILSREDIHRLNDLNMDIMSVRDGVAQIAAIPGEIEVLWANGYRPVVVVENMIADVHSLRLADRGEYHSYTELTADMAAWAANYPDITELISIGPSVEGRELWAMKITDNPDVEEFEPEIQWIGAHHGDETISAEVCYYMIEYLLENYSVDPDITWLINEREIWIIPMLNPDGYENGSRYNADGIDLNRDYYSPDGSNAGTCWRGAESRALRDFNVGMNPVTSLTFHSGAVCVNYLWDYTYDPTPDEPMIITLSNGYASYNGYWVTNGADWYIIKGSCQDWCYDVRGEIDTTIEVSTIKDPPASQITPIFNDNRDAMLYQARMSGRGIRGLVTDGGTGDPIYATISIPEIGKDVYTDPAVGDYHRMVESGTYTVICSAAEYPTQTVYNVSASLDTFVIVSFALEPPPRGAIAGYVYDESMSPLGGATVELTDIEGYSSVSAAGTGYYEINHIPVGTYDMKATKSGYTPATTDDVTVSDGMTSSENFVLSTPVFFDDFESGLAAWTGAWGTTASESYSPSRSMTDSPGGDYGNNVNTTVALQNSVDLSEATSGLLSFWHKYDTEPEYDYCYVEVSTNGGSSWTEVASYDGFLEDWTEVQIDLASYVGTSAFKVRFRLDSDGYITSDGWYVDDVAISGDVPGTGVDDVAVRGLSVSNYPNPFNPRTTVRFQMPAAGAVNVEIYDVAGRVVRAVLVDEEREAGEHEFVWDGTDDTGRETAAGIYFVRVEAEGDVASSKMVLLK
jgi:hypothetical protein